MCCSYCRPINYSRIIWSVLFCGNLFQVCHGRSKDVPDPSLFDPATGLPIVRDVVKYGELLCDIRLGRVKEIHWFTQREGKELQGPCLVEYIDGKVKQAYVANTDLRVPQAMQVRNVVNKAHQIKSKDQDLLVEVAHDVLMLWTFASYTKILQLSAAMRLQSKLYCKLSTPYPENIPWMVLASMI